MHSLRSLVRRLSLDPAHLPDVVPGLCCRPIPPEPRGAGAPAVRLGGYLQGGRPTATARTDRLDQSGRAHGVRRRREDLHRRIQAEFRTGSVGNGKASVVAHRCVHPMEAKRLRVQVGQFKTPFTREYLTSLADIETADRATVVDSIAPKRDIGIMADYALSNFATLALGVFNGENINVTANSDSALLWVGAATVRPVAYVTLGGNVASFAGDSTRYGIDLAVESWVRAQGGIHRAASERRHRGRRSRMVRAGHLSGPPVGPARGQAGGLQTRGDQPRVSAIKPPRAASTSSSGEGRCA